MRPYAHPFIAKEESIERASCPDADLEAFLCYQNWPNFRLGFLNLKSRVAHESVSLPHLIQASLVLIQIGGVILEIQWLQLRLQVRCIIVVDVCMLTNLGGAGNQARQKRKVRPYDSVGLLLPEGIAFGSILTARW